MRIYLKTSINVLCYILLCSTVDLLGHTKNPDDHDYDDDVDQEL